MYLRCKKIITSRISSYIVHVCLEILLTWKCADIIISKPGMVQIVQYGPNNIVLLLKIS